MNISNLILPLLIGRKLVDDYFWTFKVTTTIYEGIAVPRIACKGRINYKTKKGFLKSQMFQIILGINQKGNLVFNKIHLSEDSANCTQHKFIVRDTLKNLFVESLTEQLINQ